MRGFFSRHEPAFTRVLLIESGSRQLVEDLLPGIYETYGSDITLDVVTCFAGFPAGFRQEQGILFNVNEFNGAAGRKQILVDLSARNYTVLGLICSGEPIMTKWKWWLALKLPVKFFILNENGDYFWFDRGNWRVIRHFVLYRAGLSGAGAAGFVVRMLAFPLAVLYLVLYAAFIHLRRKAHT